MTDVSNTQTPRSERPNNLDVELPENKRTEAQFDNPVFSSREDQLMPKAHGTVLLMWHGRRNKKG